MCLEASHLRGLLVQRVNGCRGRGHCGPAPTGLRAAVQRLYAIALVFDGTVRLLLQNWIFRMAAISPTRLYGPWSYLLEFCGRIHWTSYGRRDVRETEIRATEMRELCLWTYVWRCGTIGSEIKFNFPESHLISKYGLADKDHDGLYQTPYWKESTRNYMTSPT